jgi:hypothetical protein
MSQFTQQQLDSFWAQYVGMNCEQVRIAETPGTDGYLGANWSAMLSYVFKESAVRFCGLFRTCSRKSQVHWHQWNVVERTYKIMI